MEWFYTKSKKQVGPVSQDELIRMISVGEVSSNDYAWREGMDDWQPISSYPELQIVAKSATDSPPPAPPNSTLPQQPTPAASKTSGLATASLCLGIGSIFLCGILFGIPAIICGHMALGEIKRSKGLVEGKAMAIVGLVGGYLSSLLTLLMIVFFVLASGAAVKHASESHSESEQAMWDQYHENLNRMEESEESDDLREPLVPDAAQ